MMNRKPLERVYHPYEKWEEIPANMWGDVIDRAMYLKKAIEFTGDHKLYGSYMKRVVSEWSISCENALTDHSLNKKAWIGHAASAMALGCPEDITRLAWGSLTDEQRLLANKEAARALRQWEVGYRENKSLRDDMGEPMLF
jgi:hypothetical protein